MQSEEKTIPESMGWRWVAILVGMLVFFYESAMPLSRKGTYFDVRFGIMVWLFFAAVVHTPMASSKVEDHPSYVFLMVFVALLLVTHATLAVFTMLHHILAWFIGFFSPSLSKAIWVPALRSIRSFKAILFASLLISGTIALAFTFCVSQVATDCSVLQNCTWDHSSWLEPETILRESCRILLPLGNRGDLFFGIWNIGNGVTFLGVDLGKLSFFETPLGLLWATGVFLWALQYTLRRFTSVDKRITVRRNTSLSSTDSTKESEDEASDDEYDISELDLNKRKSPIDFKPMAEWYSLTITRTAFQLLISMKLFLGRFDMRTMQAALRNAEYEDEEDTSSKIWERDNESDVTTPGKATSNTRYGSIDTRFASQNEMWFDWMADTGDGGNPTYAIARALAQPTLILPEFKTENSKSLMFRRPRKEQESSAMEPLPRGDLLVLGGDLAYPTPTLEEYDSRLFVPFEYAMESPPSYHRHDISMKRDGVLTENTMCSRISFLVGSLHPDGTDMLSRSVSFSSGAPSPRNIDRHQIPGENLQAEESKRAQLKPSPTFRIGSTDSLTDNAVKEVEEEDSVDSCVPPIAYALPGNHDWFDGLATFIQCICMRDWIGGWRLPQTKSYFALQLPHGWWLFGLDLALEDDIDALQYQYFAHVAVCNVGPDDQVIIMTHEPTWSLDAYLNSSCPEDKPLVRSATNLKQLMRRHLRGKVAMRIAGDIHNYMRHNAEQPLSQSALRAAASPVLVVSGAGGAFLHPTHTFPSTFKETGAQYNLKSNYPSNTQSRIVSMRNLGKGFRRQNWRFDIIGTTWYFLIVSSFFPRCDLSALLECDTFAEGASAFSYEIGAIFLEVWTDSWISMLMIVGTLLVTFSFADYHHGLYYQTIIGATHTFAHVVCSIALFLVLEISVQVAVQDGLAGQSYHSFFASFQGLERRIMPETWWTSGISETIMRMALRLFDMPENMATTRTAICTGHVSDLSRLDYGLYYLGNFLYLYVLAADVVSLVLGFYLYICVNFFNLHWNEAFSSLRCEDFKSFVRFHIDSSGDLHAYVIGIDSVPKEWVEDHRWSSSWSRLVRAHLDNSKSEVDELDPSISSHGARYPSRWTPVYIRDKKLRKKQEPRIVDYFCIPKKVKWITPRRNASVINEDWWTAFDDIENKKLFKSVSRSPSNLKFMKRPVTPPSASKRPTPIYSGMNARRNSLDT